MDKSLRAFSIWAIVLACIFSVPLYKLVRFAANSELFSYILLVPVIFAYLIWQMRESLASEFSRRCAIDASASSRRRLAVPFLIAGILLLMGWAFVERRGLAVASEDGLAMAISSFLCLIVGGGVHFLGAAVMAKVAFPAAFLVFLIPFPSGLIAGIETFFQHTSAGAAAMLFMLVGAPVFQQGLSFKLPGLIIEVAPECSGIRSSLVLLMTSLLAGNLFLRAPWRRTVLALVIIPLAILRNGFRIFSIAMLCIHVDTEMIHSPLHTRGGPVFFALSLVPFFGLLWLLRKSERVSGDMAVRRPAPVSEVKSIAGAQLGN